MRFTARNRTCGARRAWHGVLERGLLCGLHRIERLMRQNAWNAGPKGAESLGTMAPSVIVDTILDRDFEAVRPHRKCLADFTRIRTAQGWLYVEVVLDLVTRRVMGLSMKAERYATLVDRPVPDPGGP